MPSPIAHSLLGATCGLVFLTRYRGRFPAFLLFLGFVFLGCAPDCDFVPGMLAGELNRFHHGPTHSFGWALLVALGLWALWRGLEPRVVGAWVFACLFATVSIHLVADWCTVDHAEPVGVPLAWPLANSYFKAPFDVFSSMEKQTVWAIFQQANLMPALRELALTLPPLLAAALGWKIASRRSASSLAKATIR